MQAREDLQQGGLAAAGRADERDELAGRDVECHLRDGEKLFPARAIDFLDAGEMNERLGHRAHPSRASGTTSRRSSPSTIR